MSTKVLVFESDPAFAGELRNELNKLGCTTIVVDDGNVGLQQAAAGKPDLILLSIELPRMNGFSVCNKLKKDASLKDVPLIIMSSESSDETFEQHKKLRTRAEDYVHKPIAFGELLQHIQPFVSLTGAPPDSDSAIVIDDEIEIGSTDYLAEDDDALKISDPPTKKKSSTPPPLPPPADAPVDDDVDAFADAAFGRLTGNSAPPAAVAEARPLHNGNHNGNGASESIPAPPAMPRRVSSAAPRPLSNRPASVVSSRPPAGVNLAEYEKIRVELEAVRARAVETETALRDARDEAEKFRLEAGESNQLRRELEELKIKLASGPKAGAVSSREFLDLREALNKKDKEILALREQQSKKDREIVEAQDRTLALERSKSDIEDKVLVLEREVTEAREKVEALSADKDLAKKAADDFKTRLEKARAENDSKERQLVDIRTRQAGEAAAAESRLAALKADLDQTLANERADNARQVDQAEVRRKTDLDQARKEHQAAIAEAKEQAERERQESLSGQAAELKQEHDRKLATAVAATRKEGEEATAAARSDAEARGASALESLRTETSEKITALENERDSRIAAIESKAARELGEAKERLAKLDMDMSATRGELSALREAKEAGEATSSAKIAELERSLAETTSRRDELAIKLKTESDRVTNLEAEGATLRHELGDTKQKLAAESSRAEKAVAKWASDRQSLERAKDALAVALLQIEEAEGRPIS